MRLRPLIFILLALVLGAGAVVMLNNYLSSTARVAAVEAPVQPKQFIVVAAKPIAYGDPIAAESLKRIEWFAEALPAGAVADPAKLLPVAENSDSPAGTRYALQAIAEGTPVLENQLTDRVSRLSLSKLMDDNSVAIAVRVSDIAGVGGFVLPGDYIDLYLTHTVGVHTLTDLIAAGIKVLAADQNADPSAKDPQLARTLTLQMPPRQAQKVALAQQAGTLTATLRGDGSSKARRFERISSAELVVPPELSNPEAMAFVDDETWALSGRTPRNPAKRGTEIRIFRGLNATPYTLKGE